MEFFAKSFEQLTTNELYEILKSRMQIFLLEQNIVCLDLDDVDYKAKHYFLIEEGKILAYLRAFYLDEDKIKIGRVLSMTHNQGHGTVLMNNVIDCIKTEEICNTICVSAQIGAVKFYEKFGFECVSDKFLEEGVPHINMILNLK